MDETTTAPTPTAAAAATSAASAAAVTGTKAEAEGAHHIAAPSSSVELVIKSSNQQYDDIVITSDLHWTVRHLKKQLSLVYPGKPLIEDQKLIYSGKLLKDKQQLTQVIRNYKDVYTQNHIIHLVCANKNVQVSFPTTKSTTTTTTTANSTGNHNNSATMSTNANSGTDGLRQRYTTQQPSQQQQPQQFQQNPATTTEQVAMQQQAQQQMWQQQLHIRQMFAAAVAAAAETVDNTERMVAGGGSDGIGGVAMASSTPFGMPGYGQFHLQQALVAQQAAMYNVWVQQIYAQYMQQMLQGSAGGLMNTNPGDLLSNAYLQQMPFLTPPVSAPEVAMTSTQTPVISPFARFGATPAAVPSTAAAAVNGAAAQAPPEQVAPDVADEPAAAQNAAAAAAADQPVQRRFPNIQEEPEHRDWLENFFALTRMGIFITILYFNSSPLRCLVVVLIASAIYLYHIGVLRRRRERNNNNINRNNNAAVAAAVVADALANPIVELQRLMDGEQREVAQERGEGGGRGGEQRENAPAVANPPNNDAPAAAAAGTPANANVSPAAAVADDGGIVATANSTSVISVVRTFVITFFTSLLPEAPAL